MKTYPYQTPEGIIQLVEKRELDQLIERLADARESHLYASARDVQTIQRQSVMLDRLADALEKMLYIIGDPSASADKLWRTDDELNDAYHTSIEALSAYESAKLESVANPIDEAVKRMEAVPWKKLDLAWDYARGGFKESVNAIRTILIKAAKGEQI